MADWFVYRHDGDPWGPWSSERVADAIVRGEVAANVWLLAPNGARWVCALDVPVVTALVRASPLASNARHDSGMRRVVRRSDDDLRTLTSAGVTRPPAHARDPLAADATVTMVTHPRAVRPTGPGWDDEADALAETHLSSRPPMSLERERETRAIDSDLYARLRRAAAVAAAPDDEDDPPTRPARGAHESGVAPSSSERDPLDDHETVVSPRRSSG